MTATHLSGLDKCDLHRRTPYGMTNVSKTHLSVSQRFGCCTYNDENYTYFPDTDELVRDDVLKWKKKHRSQPST